jgi:competence protein ComEA
VRSGAAVCLLLSCLALLAGPRPAEAGKAVDGVVNLNTAPAEILALLPGIGPAKAAAILVYRKRRPFRTVDELVRIKGVGRKMVRRLRVHLAVAGPTTAAASAVKAAGAVVPEPTRPAPPPVHPPHAPTCHPAPQIAHLGHPAIAPGRLHARAPGQERSPARPWRAACLGPP